MEDKEVFKQYEKLKKELKEKDSKYYNIQQNNDNLSIEILKIEKSFSTVSDQKAHIEEKLSTKTKELIEEIKGLKGKNEA